MLKSLKKNLIKLMGLFKRKPQVLSLPPKTPEQIAKEKIREKYRLEYFETINLHFVNIYLMTNGGI